MKKNKAKNRSNFRNTQQQGSNYSREYDFENNRRPDHQNYQNDSSSHRWQNMESHPSQENYGTQRPYNYQNQLSSRRQSPLEGHRGHDYGSYQGQRSDNYPGRDFYNHGDEYGSSLWGSERETYADDLGSFRDDDRSLSKQKHFGGIGPKGYKRSDEAVHSEVCERLTRDPAIDASEIDVQVKDGEVTLSGQVQDRQTRRRAEDCIESVSGVADVINQIKIKRQPGLSSDMPSLHSARDEKLDRKLGKAEREAS